MDHVEDQKDSWLLVMFRSEKNNRDIGGKNNVWFSGHTSEIRWGSQFHWTDDITDVSVNIYVFHASDAWLKLKISSLAEEKTEDGNGRMEHRPALVLLSKNKNAACDVIMVLVGLNSNTSWLYSTWKHSNHFRTTCSQNWLATQRWWKRSYRLSHV